MNLYRVKELPKLCPYAIEEAVSRFIEDSKIQGVDKDGMFNQTIESIAHATMFATNDTNHFWLAHNGQDVLAYVLAHISKDIDNKLTYTISQGWVAPQLRGKKIVKLWWEKIRAEAKQRMCKHIMFPASRHPKAYLRFLGKGYHKYATLLKEDL